jgi:hypothetical protein
MSDDLIRRSDAIAEIRKARTPDVVSHQYAELFINAVRRAPSADRPQGEWMDVWQDGVCSWRGTCSNCRSTNDIPPPMLAKYCPNCGARMKGADDE